MLFNKRIKIRGVLLFSVLSLFFGVNTAMAKEYPITVDFLEQDMYSVHGGQYIIETVACIVRPLIKKPDNKTFKATAKFSLLGKYLEFEGKKVQCVIKSVYKKHNGELE